MFLMETSKQQDTRKNYPCPRAEMWTFTPRRFSGESRQFYRRKRHVVPSYSFPKRSFFVKSLERVFIFRSIADRQMHPRVHLRPRENSIADASGLGDPSRGRGQGAGGREQGERRSEGRNGGRALGLNGGPLVVRTCALVNA